MLLQLVLEELLAQEGHERLQEILGRVRARLSEEYAGQGEQADLQACLMTLVESTLAPGPTRNGYPAATGDGRRGAMG